MKRIIWFLLCPIPIIVYYVFILGYYYLLGHLFVHIEWLRHMFPISESQLYSFALCTGSAIVFTVTFWFYRHMQKNQPCFPRFRFTRATVLVLLLIALSAQYLIDLVLNGVSVLFPRAISDYMEVLEDLGVMDPTVMDLLYSIILAPFLEEVLLRGATLSIAKKAVPFWAANLIQALIFGIIHMNIVQGSYAFVMGLILGYLVYRYHSLAPAFFVHLFINFSGLLLVPASMGGLLLCLTVSAVLLYVSLKYQKRQDPEQALFTAPVPS